MSDVPHGAGSSNRGAKFWFVVALIVVALLFILLNSQEVEIKFLFATVNAPLFFALAISTLLGLVIGWAIARFRRGDHKD